MIKQSKLYENLAKFLGYTYSLKDPRYPTNIPGVGEPLAPPNQTNCCAFVEGLIIPAAQESGHKFEWGPNEHKRAVLSGGLPLGSMESVQVYIDAGLAEPWEFETSEHFGWIVCQKWDSLNTQGHTFLIAALWARPGHMRSVEGPGDPYVLVLEASSGGGGGVRWRHVGKLSEKLATVYDVYRSLNWDEMPLLPWSDLKRICPRLQCARLLVDYTR